MKGGTFILKVMVSFQIQCAGVQSQNNKKYVTFLTLYLLAALHPTYFTGWESLKLIPHFYRHILNLVLHAAILKGTMYSYR